MINKDNAKILGSTSLEEGRIQGKGSVSYLSPEEKGAVAVTSFSLKE